MLTLVPAKKEDCKFIYDALESLRGGLQVDYKLFQTYFEDSLNGLSLIYLIGVNSQNEQVSLVSLNKFEIPRYVGYGYEMEEVVVMEKHRGKGYGKEMVKQIIEMKAKESLCRKIIVKTDSPVAIKLYSSSLNTTNMVVFQKHLNKI